jgi:enamine deaminase RidA (YjgF/YER057c/UK114 family)
MARLPMAARKRPINPAELPPPIGFAHGWLVESSDSRTLYLAGQCGYDAAGCIRSEGDLVAQMELAMRNIGLVLRDAGLGYVDIVQLNFYVTSRDDYATARRAFGRVWRELCGRHYPAMAMFMVASLFDPAARIEIQGIAAA